MTEKPDGKISSQLRPEPSHLEKLELWIAERRRAAWVSMGLMTSSIVGLCMSMEDPANLTTVHPTPTAYSGNPLPQNEKGFPKSNPFHATEDTKLKDGTLNPSSVGLPLNDNWVNVQTNSVVNSLDVLKPVRFDGFSLNFDLTRRTYQNTGSLTLVTPRRDQSEKGIVPDQTTRHLDAIADYLKEADPDAATAIEGIEVSSSFPETIGSAEGKDNQNHARAGGIEAVANLIDKLESLGGDSTISSEERKQLIGHLQDAGASIETPEDQFTEQEWITLDTFARGHPHVPGCDSLDPTTRIFSLIDFYQRHPQDVDQVVGDYLFKVLSSKRLVKVTITTEQGVTVTKSVSLPVFALYLLVPTWLLQRRGRKSQLKIIAQEMVRFEYREIFKNMDDLVVWDRPSFDVAIRDSLFQVFFSSEERKGVNGFMNLANYVMGDIQGSQETFSDWYWWRKLGLDLTLLISERIRREIGDKNYTKLGSKYSVGIVGASRAQADFLIKMAIAWTSADSSKPPNLKQYDKLFTRLFELIYAEIRDGGMDGDRITRKLSAYDLQMLIEESTKSQDKAHKAAVRLYNLLELPNYESGVQR